MINCKVTLHAKYLLKTYWYIYAFNNVKTTIRTSFRFISLINVLLVIRHNDMEANLAVLGYVSFFYFYFSSRSLPRRFSRAKRERAGSAWCTTSLRSWFHQRVSFYCCQFNTVLNILPSRYEPPASTARTIHLLACWANQAAMKDHVQPQPRSHLCNLRAHRRPSLTPGRSSLSLSLFFTFPSSFAFSRT